MKVILGIVLFIFELNTLAAPATDSPTVEIFKLKKPISLESNETILIQKSKKLNQTTCHINFENTYSSEISCGGDSAFISNQSLISKPSYTISLDIPIKDTPYKVTKTFQLQPDSDCKSLECFNEHDFRAEILKSKEGLFRQLQASTQYDLDFSNEDEIEVSANIKYADIDHSTPIFSSPLKEVITKPADILGNNTFDGLVISPEEITEKILEGSSIEFVEPDEAYRQKYLRPIEDLANDDFEMTDYSDEFELHQRGIDPPDENTIFDETNLSTLNSSGTEIENSLTQKNSQVEDDNLVISPELQMPKNKNDERENTGKFEDQTIKLNIGGKELQITHHKSYTDQNGEQIDEFTIKDGDRSQRFETNEFITLEMGEDLLGELTLGDNQIEYKFQGDETVNPLMATPLSQLVEGEAREAQVNLELKNCMTSLNDFLKNKNFNEAAIQKFLNLQGRLTLHRLAWAHLNKAGAKDKLENHILKLIKEKYSNENQKIAKEFDNMNLKSRNFLAKSLPHVMDVLYQQSEEQDLHTSAYKLHESDLKFLEMVAEYEEYKSDHYDHRQYDTDSISQNITNFTTIINSSYQNSNHKLQNENDIPKNQDLLITEISKLEKELENMIKTFIFQSCFGPKGMTCEDARNEVESLFEKEMTTLLPGIIQSIRSTKDEDYLKDIRFRKLWLKVAK